MVINYADALLFLDNTYQTPTEVIRGHDGSITPAFGDYRDNFLLELELRKVKALEKIGNSLDSLTIWFEEIDKDEWGNRIQFYLAEFHNKFVKDEE